MAKGAEKAITFYPFGILWKIMGYKGSVLPALLVAIIGAKTERGLRRIVPDAGGTIAQATAALVTGFKMRDPKKRGFYMSASLPAFMGITEPAILVSTCALVGRSCSPSVAVRRRASLAPFSARQAQEWALLPFRV